MLIDEFQDTDPVQAELALLLTSDEPPGADWRTLRPAPGRLTVVGDPKQSIYRFRRADIAVYDQVKDGGARGRERADLDELPLEPAAARVPERRVRRDPPRPSPASSPATSRSTRRATPTRHGEPPVVVAEGRFDGNAEGMRPEEARVIAGLLHTARRDGWEIRDRHDENAWRPCRWGDMAILMPARTGIEHYEQALAAAGIPYRHEGSRDFFQREEVRDLIWVLSAIDDPTDRLALVGALRSSAFAISDEELVIHVAAAGALTTARPGRGRATS